MKKIITPIFVTFICLNSFAQIPAPVAAATTATESLKLEDLKALDYPELQVVPRASERLILETANASDSGVGSLLPYVLSSTMTLLSGAVVNSSIREDFDEQRRLETSRSAKGAMIVGAAGLGLAYWFTHADFYGSSLNQIRALKNKDRRTELLKERLAEESFERSAQMISQWKWVFAITNIVASAELTGKSTGDNNIVPSLSVAAALLPLFISTSYETNYQKQMEYKKRIYVPLTWFDYKYNPSQASWQPEFNLVWNF